MKYKVDDKVKIRSWDSMEQEFGLTESSNIKVRGCFLIGMKRWCDKIVTIKSVCLNHYRIKEDSQNWTDEMINHSAIEKLNSVIIRLELLKEVVQEIKDFENITGCNKKNF